jgi:hypothetical protein
MSGTPIKEEVVQAVKARLDAIVTDVAVATGVTRVQRATMDRGSINPAHGVIALWPGDAAPAAGPEGFLSWWLPIDLYCYVAQAEGSAAPIDVAVSAFEADVMKWLCDEAWLVALDGLIVEVKFDAESRFTADGGLAGTVVAASFQFRHLFTDPYSRGG